MLWKFIKKKSPSKNLSEKTVYNKLMVSCILNVQESSLFVIRNRTTCSSSPANVSGILYFIYIHNVQKL